MEAVKIWYECLAQDKSEQRKLMYALLLNWQPRRNGGMVQYAWYCYSSGTSHLRTWPAISLLKSFFDDLIPAGNGNHQQYF